MAHPYGFRRILSLGTHLHSNPRPYIHNSCRPPAPPASHSGIAAGAHTPAPLRECPHAAPSSPTSRGAHVRPPATHPPLGGQHGLRLLLVRRVKGQWWRGRVAVVVDYNAHGSPKEGRHGGPLWKVLGVLARRVAREHVGGA